MTTIASSTAALILIILALTACLLAYTWVSVVASSYMKVSSNAGFRLYSPILIKVEAVSVYTVNEEYRVRLILRNLGEQK